MESAINISAIPGASPLQSDVVFIPVDSRGSMSFEMHNVLERLSYLPEELPNEHDLRSGFYLRKPAGKIPAIFVVIVSMSKIEMNISHNLKQAFYKHEPEFKNKRYWIPLMGIENGLTVQRSFILLLIEVAEIFNRKFNAPSEVIFSLPAKITKGDFETILKKIDDIKSKYTAPGTSRKENKVSPEEILKDYRSLIQAAVTDSVLTLDDLKSLMSNPFTILHLTTPAKMRLQTSISRLQQSYTLLRANQKSLVMDGINQIILPFFEAPPPAEDENTEEEESLIEEGNDEENVYATHFLAGFDSSKGSLETEFYKTNTWRQIPNGNNNVNAVISALPGSIVFLKSTFRKNKTGYLRIKAIGVITENPRNGISLNVNWQLKNLEVDIPDLGHFRRAFARVTPERLPIILQALEEVPGAQSILYPDEPLPPEYTYTSNSLQRATVNNDGIYDPNKKDLLGFENDIRSFASLIALKDLKPPLAIALFGKWGSGKSFFMRNLQDKIDFLSRHQGFEEPAQKNEGASKNEKPFCEGIVQISFNAWSYMDANLWASLVANIFEKLDNYISNQDDAKAEKQKIRDKLSEKLIIVRNEKKRVTEQKEELANKKQELQSAVVELEKSKEELIQKVIHKEWDAIVQEVKQKTDLEPGIKNQLHRYGISADYIAQASPAAVYQEYASWITFLRNYFQLSVKECIGFTLLFLAFLLVSINPGGILDDVMNTGGKAVAAFFSFTAPFMVKWISTFRQYSRLAQPLATFRDNYNQKIEEAKFNYQRELDTLNLNIKQTEKEIEEKNHELAEIDQKIDDVEYELKYSVTRQAFYNFIKAKARDEKYEKYLGLISIIRRDFETLNELFQEHIIPTDIPEEEKQRMLKRKAESDEFRLQFEKPLDRIVLYIDDLDRCPEDRVIEVLEAVNLLMAFPLFVVVVGVDPRWIRNALIKKYQLQFTGINGQHSVKEAQVINVTDYLEKIFQIPFHLQEASSLGVDKLLDDLFSGQVEETETVETDEAEEPMPQEETEEIGIEPGEVEQRVLKYMEELERDDEKEENEIYSQGAATGGGKPLRFVPRSLKISRQELEDMKDLAWLAGNNPRTLKRFVNMYRIIRAHENLKYREDAERQDFLSVMFILGLSIGEHKSTTPQFYKNCRQHPEKFLSELITEEKLKHLMEEKLKEIKALAPVKKIKGKDLNEYIPFVKRFSFESEEMGK